MPSYPELLLGFPNLEFNKAIARNTSKQTASKPYILHKKPIRRGFTLNNLTNENLSKRAGSESLRLYVYICGLPKSNKEYEEILMGPDLSGRSVFRLLEN